MARDLALGQQAISSRTPPRTAVVWQYIGYRRLPVGRRRGGRPISSKSKAASIRALWRDAALDLKDHDRTSSGPESVSPQRRPCGRRAIARIGRPTPSQG